VLVLMAVTSPVTHAPRRVTLGPFARRPVTYGPPRGHRQIWRPINVIDSGYRVYRNEANGLVMTLSGDFNGAPLQIRSLGLGTGGNKNFRFVHSAP